MTDEQIKEMLNGIINNGEKWECRECNELDTRTDLNKHKFEWQPYKIGEGIHEDWEYRKVETWLEEYLYSNYGENAQYYIRIGAKEVCKKILEEMENRALSSVSATTLRNIFKDLGIEL